ncbi:DUF1993 domain-containing protein [Caulobacter radicis]|uniref:DUF1993 domain-containing protein n=1 Tax=Caulobacter radicis TaxID=2172650 RepID=A0A2T9IXX9_9CAUL|nr:DUF1993 domain-containing protein [Caulobacter radicis]PVM71963.1 DUF1993 domain-containing protein [Caulobacter radicis]
MSLSIHHVTATALTRGLQTLSALLDKADAHARAAGSDPDAFVQARLYEDMLPLAGQIQRASDAARGAMARLGGVTAPSMADDETTLAQLRDRVARTLDYVRGVPAEAFEGAETREVVFAAGPLTLGFSGLDYLLEFALPNFQFHVVTAYDILRHHGVPLGKRDYLNLGAERVRTA